MIIFEGVDRSLRERVVFKFVSSLSELNAGLCLGRNQSGCGACTGADRASRGVGRAPGDPLLSFSVLYAFWDAGFNGDVCRDLAGQFQTLAAKQGRRSRS